MKKITEERPFAVGVGKPRLSWEGDVREDLGRRKIQDWSKVAMYTETWKRTVEQAKTHQEL